MHGKESLGRKPSVDLLQVDQAELNLPLYHVAPPRRPPCYFGSGPAAGSLRILTCDKHARHTLPMAPEYEIDTISALDVLGDEIHNLPPRRPLKGPSINTLFILPFRV